MQNDRVKLDEVVLEADIFDRNAYYKEKRSLLLKRSSFTVDFDDIIFVPIQDWRTALIGRVPGYAYNHKIRGRIPKYFLDGMPVDTIADLAGFDIDFVDILHDGAASIMGASSIVAAYTKDGSEKPNTTKGYKKRGIISFEHPGYQTKKFYEPLYKTQKKDGDKADYRRTIYWNPTLKLNEQHKASISFYTSDMISPYRIILEGISLDGKIIRHETYLNCSSN